MIYIPFIDYYLSTRNLIIICVGVALFILVYVLLFVIYFKNKKKTITYRKLNKYKRLFKLCPLEVIDNRRVYYVSDRGISLYNDTTSRGYYSQKTMTIYQYNKKKKRNKRYSFSINISWIFMILFIALSIASILIFLIFQFNTHLLSNLSDSIRTALAYIGHPIICIFSVLGSLFFFTSLILAYKTRNIYKVYIDAYLNFANRELLNEFYKPLVVKVG